MYVLVISLDKFRCDETSSEERRTFRRVFGQFLFPRIDGKPDCFIGSESGLTGAMMMQQPVTSNAKRTQPEWLYPWEVFFVLRTVYGSGEKDPQLK